MTFLIRLPHEPLKKAPVGGDHTQIPLNKHFDKKFVAGAGYLLAGLAGAALVTYSGYLGGRMVYTHGVGVTPADGIEPERTPEMPHDGFGKAARASASNVGHALRHTAHEMAQGEIVPRFQERPSAGEPTAG